MYDMVVQVKTPENVSLHVQCADRRGNQSEHGCLIVN
jgi:hypothetical protein